MTKITIDIEHCEIQSKPQNACYTLNKIYKAYEKAIEGDIKVGDLVYNLRNGRNETPTLFEVESQTQGDNCKNDNRCHKLPKELQEPLKKWIEGFKK